MSLHGRGRALLAWSPALEDQRAHEDLGVEDRLGATTSDHVIAAVRSTSARTAPASREARIDCGRTRPTRPPSGRARRTARARNSTAASAYGPPPCRLDPPRLVVTASCDRYGGLPTTTSKLSPSQPAASASRHSIVASASVVASRAAATASGSMSDADQDRAASEGADPAGGGDEEATVAARRIEDADIPAGTPNGDGLLDDGLDEPVWASDMHRAACAHRSRFAAGARPERRVRG